MTKKDYERIAEVFAADKPADMDRGYTWWPGLVNRLADALAADNPRFARAWFLKACGMEG